MRQNCQCGFKCGGLENFQQLLHDVLATRLGFIDLYLFCGLPDKFI